MLGDRARKRPATVRELLVVVGLFAVDFAAWVSFPEVTFFAFLGLVALLAGIAAFYVPPPWDVLVAGTLGLLCLGVVVGLLVSP
ncbi:hypothetical protein [Tautonia plasticadhaerens]|uniref:Uncharacterized protein n=1 Tax=Tautonia plasticadhaerens TaxID=2527974 RepID=A0A518GX39_9BACT|nr:hypothetical protein [Tautonia plasticadhaerens]QDV33150.1 hypothetical protein ElP_09920 [Tautonia plasticadhaerens]